jgi:hypothetical protein
VPEKLPYDLPKRTRFSPTKLCQRAQRGWQQHLLHTRWFGTVSRTERGQYTAGGLILVFSNNDKKRGGNQSSQNRSRSKDLQTSDLKSLQGGMIKVKVSFLPSDTCIAHTDTPPDLLWLWCCGVSLRLYSLACEVITLALSNKLYQET